MNRVEVRGVGAECVRASGLMLLVCGMLFVCTACVRPDSIAWAQNSPAIEPMERTTPTALAQFPDMDDLPDARP